MFIKETLRFKDSRIVDPEKFAVNSNFGMNLNFGNQCWHSTCIFSLLRISSSEAESVLLFQTFSTQIPRLMTSFNLIWFYLSKKKQKQKQSPIHLLFYQERWVFISYLMGTHTIGCRRLKVLDRGNIMMKQVVKLSWETLYTERESSANSIFINLVKTQKANKCVFSSWDFCWTSLRIS